jgi:hypothetical protein
MSRFEDRLLTYLVSEHGAVLRAADVPAPRHEPRQHWTQRWRISAAVAGLAVAAAILVTSLTLPGGSSTPAYAVEVQTDGAVVLTLDEIVGAAAANAQLAKLGVRATVARVEQGCTEKGVVDRSYTAISIMQDMLHRSHSGGQIQGKAQWIITPSAIPAGDTLGLFAQQSEGTTQAVGYGFALYRGAAPQCTAPGDFHLN